MMQKSANGKRYFNGAGKGDRERDKLGAKKSYGQHFLKDETVLDRIIDVSKLTVDDIVIEIGAGKGALTKRLSPLVKHLLAIELDPRMVEHLYSEFSEGGNVTIVHSDVVRLDPISLICSKYPDYVGKFKLVANIPYNITTPIVEWLIKHRDKLDLAVIMVQDEVAKKLAAKPSKPDYSAISAKVQFCMVPEIIMKVPSTSFAPPPKVESAVIKLVPLEELPYDKEEVFKIIDESFRQRRKNIKNSLASGTMFAQNPALIEAVLRESQIEPTQRAENLSVEKYIEMAKNYAKLALSIEK